MNDQEAILDLFHQILDMAELETFDELTNYSSHMIKDLILWKEKGKELYPERNFTEGFSDFYTKSKIELDQDLWIYIFQEWFLGMPVFVACKGKRERILLLDDNKIGLDLSGKEIDNISEIHGLKQLTSLESLNLTNNNISEIKGLENLPNLVEISLDRNSIKKIQGLDTLKKLKLLSLMENRITEIEGLDRLPNLRKLYLSSNKITELKGLDNVPLLQSLDLSYNFIPEIRGLDHLINLNYLNLKKNDLTSIKGLESNKNLKNLYLSMNLIRNVSEISNNRQIEVLKLDSNPLTILDGIQELQNLRKIDLHDTGVSDITPLFGLKNLEILNLGESRFRNGRNLNKLNNLKGFDLSGCNLVSLPDIRKMPNLEYQNIDLFTPIRFIKEDLFLCPYTNIKDGAMRLVIRKINPETQEILLEDTIRCVHTGVIDISQDKYAEIHQNKDEFDEFMKESLKNSKVDENTQIIRLTPKEQMFAFESWTQGIAEAGYDALKIQIEIEEIAHQMYPIAHFLMRFLAKADDEFLYEYLSKIERECRYEGERHESSLLANLIPIIHAIIIPEHNVRLGSWITNPDDDDYFYDFTSRCFIKHNIKTILPVIFDMVDDPKRLFDNTVIYEHLKTIIEADSINQFKHAKSQAHIHSFF